MAEYLIQESTLTELADAIRDKTGIVGDLTVNQMINEIDSISSGSGPGKFSELLNNEITVLTRTDLSGVKSLRDYAFAYTTNLKTAYLPDNIIAIPNNCFYYSSIEEVQFPTTLTSISNYAFYNTKIKNVDLPNSLTSIGDYAFARTYLETITIPKLVTTIESRVLDNVNTLKKIIINGDIVDINSYAISSTKLEEIYFNNNTAIPTLKSTSFSSLPTTCKIFVPVDLYDDWIAASNWSRYADQIYPNKLYISNKEINYYLSNNINIDVPFILDANNVNYELTAPTGITITKSEFMFGIPNIFKFTLQADENIVNEGEYTIGLKIYDTLDATNYVSTEFTLDITNTDVYFYYNISDVEGSDLGFILDTAGEYYHRTYVPYGTKVMSKISITTDGRRDIYIDTKMNASGGTFRFGLSTVNTELPTNTYVQDDDRSLYFAIYGTPDTTGQTDRLSYGILPRGYYDIYVKANDMYSTINYIGYKLYVEKVT